MDAVFVMRGRPVSIEEESPWSKGLTGRDEIGWESGAGSSGKTVTPRGGEGGGKAGSWSLDIREGLVELAISPGVDRHARRGMETYPAWRWYDSFHSS